jgi:prepilin-type N-terminal cleavage/methylation domain-containing protein
MKSHPPRKSSPAVGGRAAFTLMELMIAMTISTVVLAFTVTFVTIAARTTSGIVQQTTINTQAGQTSLYLFDKVRYATSITNDTSGNTLTLGFDDNPESDSDNDKTTYNDKNRFVIIQFRNGDGKDSTLDDNQLIAYSRTNSTFGPTNVLIASSIGKLAGRNVFTITNQTTTVIVNYLLADSFDTDGYQSSAVSSYFIARNRPDPGGVIKILP